MQMSTQHEFMLVIKCSLLAWTEGGVHQYEHYRKHKEGVAGHMHIHTYHAGMQHAHSKGLVGLCTLSQCHQAIVYTVTLSLAQLCLLGQFHTVICSI